MTPHRCSLTGSFARCALVAAMVGILAACGLSRPAPVKQTYLLQPQSPAQAASTPRPGTLKIGTIATRIYGATEVHFLPPAEASIARFEGHGLDRLPICMAKTHLSLSDDPTLLNAPENFTLHIRDIRAYTGAGWLVPLCGEIMTMPGLGASAAAFDVDIDEAGRTVGLF